MDSTAARNRAFARNLYDRYIAGDLEAVLGSLAEDAVWESECDGLPWSGCFIGAAARDYFTRLAEACEVRGYRVERMLADEEWVAVFATAVIRMRDSGREETFRKVDTLRIRGDRILEFREYYDTARARAALEGR